MSKLAAKIALIGALAIAPAMPALSQTGTGTGTGTTTEVPGTGTTVNNAEYNQEGRNGYWGLLGLLGLFGLLGRKSNRDERNTSTAYRDPAEMGTRDRY